MATRYLIRLDDACETFDRKKWQAIEAIFDRLGIRPIVAIVPSNADETLNFDAPHADFWQMVRDWQSKGWHIALHGYRHVYHHIDRRNLLLPFYDRSEFAGLDLATQSNMLRAGLAVFRREGVTPTVWVAPSHTFDETTLRALKEATEVRVVSDGIALAPYLKDGFTFVPQQLWWPKKRPAGLWTICLHPNTMTDEQIHQLESSLDDGFYINRFADLESEIRNAATVGFPGWVYAQYFWLMRTLRETLS